MKPKLGKKNQNYKQGIFRPRFPEKYKGSFPIVYRSGLEMISFRWMDNNPNIITWGSESVIIPYQSPLDGRVHRYFVDLVASLKQTDGTIKKLLIEVKPEKQTKQPQPSKNKAPKTMIYEQTQYVTNMAKWKSAGEWCSKHGYQFIILTEKHLKV